MSEIKARNPELPYFDENYQGHYKEINFTITKEDLDELYPTASNKAKEDPERMEKGQDDDAALR